MADFYLDFEKPLKVIDQKIIEMETSDDPDSKRSRIEELKEQRKQELKSIFSGVFQSLNKNLPLSVKYCFHYNFNVKRQALILNIIMIQ